MNEASRALEEIRHTELEAARRVEEARAHSAEIVSDARGRAHELVEAARRRGREAAERHMETARADVEAEANELAQRGETGARALRESASRRMGQLVDSLVEVVLSPPEDGGE